MTKFQKNFRQAIRTIIAAVVVIALGFSIQVSSALADKEALETLPPNKTITIPLPEVEKPSLGIVEPLESKKNPSVWKLERVGEKNLIMKIQKERKKKR